MTASSRTREGSDFELEATFRDFYDHAPDMYFSVDAATAHVLHCNETLVRAIGYSREEVIGRSIFELYHPDSRGGAKQVFQKFVTEGEVHDVELQLLCKDGSKLDVSLSITAIRDEKGKVLRSRSVWRDITERKRTEGRLRLTQFALDNCANPIYWVQEDGRICYANQAACEALGYSRERLVELSVPDIDPDFPKERWQSHWQILKSAGSSSFEAHHRKADGSVFPVEIVTSFLEHGSVGYIWAYVTDISQRRRAEADKGALESKLGHARKMEAIGQLAGGIAHDFNNLLTVILGNAELLTIHLEHGLDGQPDAMAQQVVEQITYAGKRATALTRQLLSFSRRDLVQAEVLNPEVVVRGTGEILRRLLKEDIEFEVVVDASGHSVRADAAQIEQVIMNLVLNARDSLPDGGAIELQCRYIDLTPAHPAVRTGAIPGPHVVISVSDTGAGMSRETMEHIYEPFFTTKPIGSGTGLGLATVYGIVKQSNAQILVESEVGKGSRFDVFFPATRETASEQEPDGMNSRSSTGEVVLVCEDEELVRDIVSRSLRQAGYEVLEAGTSAAALDLIAGIDGQIDLLVTDVIMPRMNGKQLAGKLRESFPSMQVLFISGYTSDLIQPDLLEMSHVSFMQKPFSPVTLLSRVRSILDRAQSESS